MSKRLLICSLRNLRKEVFRCFDYEFEDVIADLEDADYIFPEPRSPSPLWTNIVETLSKRTRSLPWNPAFVFPPIKERYDYFVAVVMFAYDLDVLARMPDWTSKVGYSICYIDELFIRSLEQYPKSLKTLERFDLLVLNCAGTQEDLSSSFPIKTTVVSSGIDAMRFCPRDLHQERKIDLHSMGRRNEELHDEFLKLARKDHWLYLYDTTLLPTVEDHKLHRDALASRLQHSRFFIVNPAKFNCQIDSGTQEEIGFRYFEGSAAGTVMVGKIPNNPCFHHYFPWDDAVIELPDDPSDACDLLSGLMQDEERLQRITFENVKGALERHDFVYRWEEILKAAEIEPLPAVERRKGMLNEKRESWITQFQSG